MPAARSSLCLELLNWAFALFSSTRFFTYLPTLFAIHQQWRLEPASVVDLVRLGGFERWHGSLAVREQGAPGQPGHPGDGRQCVHVPGHWRSDHPVPVIEPRCEWFAIVATSSVIPAALIAVISWRVDACPQRRKTKRCSEKSPPASGGEQRADQHRPARPWWSFDQRRLGRMRRPGAASSSQGRVAHGISPDAVRARWRQHSSASRTPPLETARTRRAAPHSERAAPPYQ